MPEACRIEGLVHRRRDEVKASGFDGRLAQGATPSRTGCMARRGTAAPGGATGPTIDFISTAMPLAPGTRDKELFEQTDGIAVGHARQEIATRRIDTIDLEDGRVEKTSRSFSDLGVDSFEDTPRLLELGRSRIIFVDGLE